MSDMYEKVSRPERRPRRGRGIALGIALAAAVLAIGVWLLSVFGVLSVRPKFYQFVSALSDSTIYAYDNHTLRAEGNGQSVRVSGDNAYAIYRGMSAWSPTGLPR